MLSVYWRPDMLRLSVESAWTSSRAYENPPTLRHLLRPSLAAAGQQAYQVIVVQPASGQQAEQMIVGDIVSAIGPQ